MRKKVEKPPTKRRSAAVTIEFVAAMPAIDGLEIEFTPSPAIAARRNKAAQAAEQAKA